MQSPGKRPPAGGKVALAQYRQRAARYDAELALFEPVRTQAIAALALEPGERVLDVGCGTGLSFGPLEERIGEGGHIVGIEQSPEMMALARQRVDEQGWGNVTLITAPADSAALQGRADAALFHFTHDVLRDRRSLDNVLRHLRPGARVVASGLQWAPPWAWPANCFVAAAALYSVSSLEGLARPFDRLVARLEGVEIHTTMLGGIFVASGTLKPAARRRR